MEITFLYFEACPNWRVAYQRLTDVLAEQVDPPAVELVAVTSAEQADRLGFRGSPSILVDGRDLLASSDAPVGLSCRVYQTADGPAGAPTVGQIRSIVAR